MMLNGSYAIWKWRFGLFSQEVFTGCQFYSVGVGRGGKKQYFMWLDNGSGRSQTTGHM